MNSVEPLVWTFETASEAETENLGRDLADCLTPGVALLLSGDLGCGKSVLARGVLWGLGVADDCITSPTFTLVNPYDSGRLPAAHFDLYRLSAPEELELVGVEEYVDGRGVVIVEWPERGEGEFFGAVIRVNLEDLPGNPQGRRLVFSAVEPLSRECLHVFGEHNAGKGLRGGSGVSA
ncbi:MAG: tRNA (adenosine(37)-N6)-threonylcarbamoyltransferase complex ATPase subunit type 1 TsaE [Magnetococcales bacterium]|nr:tRNA (adenosine(37)-N6)-threonylcarbamoyltransferase complex ATPase subunit type 1 TsaE [Magnetococcales bacterium]